MRSATSSLRKGIKQGDVIETGAQADIKPGNNLPLRNIPTGTVVHAIELRPLGGAKIARSAGAAVQLVAKDGAYAQLRMPSGEIRNVDARCRATVGEVGNPITPTSSSVRQVVHVGWASARSPVVNP